MYKLNKNDYIGVVAPSDYIEEKDLEYINASIILMEVIGFKVKFGKHVFENTLKYGTNPKDRAEDINEMFKDEEVKAIICVKGGEDSNSVFEYLDYDAIKKNPKIICGFSDNTSVLNIINEKCNMITFHGPTFKSLTSWDTDFAYKKFIQFFCKENRILGEKEDYKVIKEGEAEGKLIGGNLSLFSKLIAGKYSLDVKDKILFLEELGYESSPEMVNSNLYYLKQNGIFDKIKGLWIGNYTHPSNISLEKIVMDVIGDNYNFPIIKSDNFGHIDKKIIVPIGAKAKINTKDEEKIKLIDENLR